MKILFKVFLALAFFSGIAQAGELLKIPTRDGIRTTLV